MKFLSKSIALCLIVAAGAAMAQSRASNPVVKARQDVMQVIRVNTGVLGDMASGKSAFDTAAATAAKTALAAAAADIVVTFQPEEDDPNSEATPRIWQDWAGFSGGAEVLLTAAEAMDTASLDGLRAGMGGVGGACRDCHQGYRAKR